MDQQVDIWTFLKWINTKDSQYKQFKIIEILNATNKHSLGNLNSPFYVS